MQDLGSYIALIILLTVVGLGIANFFYLGWWRSAGLRARRENGQR
jgi:hypothetical protein